MELALVDTVALQAVLYRSCAHNRHTGPESYLEDVENGHDQGLSFAQLIAHSRFTPLDWQITSFLCDYDMNDAREIAHRLHDEEQFVEAEAMLHAAFRPGNGFYGGTRTDWLQPYYARWQKVRRCMRQYEREFALTHATLDDLADWATEQLTGLDRKDAEERYGDIFRSRWADMGIEEAAELLGVDLV